MAAMRIVLLVILVLAGAWATAAVATEAFSRWHKPRGQMIDIRTAGNPDGGGRLLRRGGLRSHPTEAGGEGSSFLRI
jgi:hypothetical protein